LVDASTNTNALASATVTAADTTAPTFTADRTALNSITLTFSETITSTGADTDNFTVVGAGSVSAGAQAGGTTIVLTTTGLTSTSSTPNVAYVQANGDVADQSASGAVALADGANANADDSVVPTFSGEGLTSTTTRVDFSETIDGTLTFSQWTFDSQATSAVSGQTNGATLSDVTTLTFTHGSTSDPTPDISYTAGNLVDNSVTGTNALATATVTADDTTAPTITAIDLTNTTTITVTFDETVSTPSTSTTNNWLLTGGAGTPSITAVQNISGGSSTQTITITGYEGGQLQLEYTQAGSQDIALTISNYDGGACKVNCSNCWCSVIIYISCCCVSQ